MSATPETLKKSSSSSAVPKQQDFSKNDDSVAKALKELKLVRTSSKTSHDWPVNSAQYTLIAMVGRGMKDTQVWKAECTSNKQTVAIKKIDLQNISVQNPAFLKKLETEIQIMAESKNQYIVEFYCSFVEETTLWIVMEFCDVGSIADLMTYAGQGLKEEELTLACLFQILSGLKYLHRDKKLHRDVKGGNALISSGGGVKLSDFGVASTFSRKNLRTTFVGTPCWMAPEVIQVLGQDNPNPKKIRIWTCCRYLELWDYGY